MTPTHPGESVNITTVFCVQSTNLVQMTFNIEIVRGRESERVTKSEP